MKRSSLQEMAVFAVLLASGVMLRWQLRDIPNFAPVMAISLFAGCYFRSWLTAAALPLAIMSISDCWIGGYDFQMMLLVYGMLALPVACRGLVRFPGVAKSGAARGELARAGSPVAKWLLRVGAGSLGASCAFFLVTNFGAWLWFDMYDRTWIGLLECYAAALPFFRHTLMGDLFFGCVLFGGYSGAWAAGLVSRDEAAVATARV